MPQNMMSVLTIIPARMDAVRFHGKPLHDILGKPMILHCWETAVTADIGAVIVACGDQEIYDCVTAAGGTAILTDPALPSGSDRIYAALQEFDKQGKYEIIVNLQGDLPSLPAGTLQACLQLLEAEIAYDIATVAVLMNSAEDINNPDIVKVMMVADGATGRAYGFSRAPVPYGDGDCYHHIGIYAYRRKALERFVSLPPSPLEKREKLEQWRALEADMKIGVALIDEVPPSVDVPADIAKAEAYLRDRPLT